VIQFIFSGLTKFEHWWIVLDGQGERELCVENPGLPADLQIRSDVRTMVEIWAGDTAIPAATKAGRLKLSGLPALIKSLPTWLRIGLLAGTRPHSKLTGARAKAGSRPYLRRAEQ
jgi:hypothetical protein